MIKKLSKFIKIIKSGNKLWLNALRLGSAAGVEHEPVMAVINCKIVVDIGANRGQFALAARKNYPNARIVSFEPLSEPAAIFKKIFVDDVAIELHCYAIGPISSQGEIHVSARDDSSSLLSITPLQEEKFPGTTEVDVRSVKIAPLITFLSEEDIVSPALLKLDVQGYEFEALKGCETLLHKFDLIYCECSFIELYTSQKLASDVIDWLSDKGFRIDGVYNPTYDDKGKAIQADMLFKNYFSKHCGNNIE